MIVLWRQDIGKDIYTVTEHMIDRSTKSYPDMIKFADSKIYSLNFRFIFEDEEDKRDYWLKMWRLKRNTDFLNWCIIGILKGEEIIAHKK